MRFQLTMNMASSQGNPSHPMTVEYPADSLEAFKRVLEDEDFIIVEEWYRDEKGRTYTRKGDIVIQTLLVGKAREFR